MIVLLINILYKYVFDFKKCPFTFYYEQFDLNVFIPYQIMSSYLYI